MKRSGTLTTFMRSQTSAEAWLKVMMHLLTCSDGKDFNLIVVIAKPCLEIPEATRVVDAVARDLELKSTMENANSIWPSVFARPGRPSDDVFADIERFAVPGIKIACKNRHDSYVERLVAWRSFEGAGKVPQLQNVLARLKQEVNNRAPKSSSYEISVFSPGVDAGYMSFPCLSHLSIKYDHHHNLVHLTALYRNHTFLSHAYGNYLGLGRLLAFICRETRANPGELVSISTHADAELCRGKSRIRDAVQQMRTLLIALAPGDAVRA